MGNTRYSLRLNASPARALTARVQLANPCSEWGRFKTPTRAVTDSNPCSHCTPVPRFPKGSRGKVRNVGTAHQKKARRKAHRRTLAKASRRNAAPEDAQNGQSWPHRWRITCQRRAVRKLGAPEPASGSFSANAQRQPRPHRRTFTDLRERLTRAELQLTDQRSKPRRWWPF